VVGAIPLEQAIEKVRQAARHLVVELRKGERRLARPALRGKSRPIEVYELLALRDAGHDDRPPTEPGCDTRVPPLSSNG
jgi:hypothetical protein